MSSRRLGPCLLVAALLVAGCMAPVAEGGVAGPTDGGADGAASPPLEPANVSVTGGNLTVDPGLVFVRVEALLDADVVPPDRIRVPEPDADGNDSSGGVALRPFREAVGLRAGPPQNASAIRGGIFGVTYSIGPIVTYPGENDTADDQRLVLAHEFVHYVQYQNERHIAIAREVDVTTTDGRFVQRSLLEGVAVFTTDAYMARYTENGTRNSPLYRRIHRSFPPGHVARYGNSKYLEGHEYVVSRVDDPANVGRIYRNPPRTSEQVIHNLSPAAEPVVALDASVAPADAWRRVGTNRLGEGFVRTTLAVGVPPERAARAAAGWGNDRLYVYRNASRANASYVWTFAWDDAENATEFRRAASEYLDARGRRIDGVWRLDDGRTARLASPTARSTVLLLGTERFVDLTTVSVAAG